MPPKQHVDLDLDALAPPNRTIRLKGKVYEIPGDIGMDTVVHAMQFQKRMQDTEDDTESFAALNDLLELIYDLFRECDPNFEPIPLTLTQILNILGLILSGMNVDFETAVKEALVGDEPAAGDTQSDKGGEHPPTPRSRGKKAASRSAPLSSVPS